MANITAHQTKDYARVLRRVWSGDAALLSTWHVAAPCDLTTAVAASVAVLEGHDMASDFTFYELWCGSDVVGFLGVEPATNFLVTFGLRLGYRTPEIKAALWEWIRTFTDPNRPVCCGLYTRNERAHRFLQAGGGQLVSTVEYDGREAALYLLN